MPNHVKNRLTITADPAELGKFLAERFTEGRLDFEKIIPLIGCYVGGNSQVHDKLFGTNCGNTMATEKWFTKWNSYSNKPIGRPSPGVAVIEFETAWNAPHPIILEIQRLLKCELLHEWSCEGDCTWGRILYRDRIAVLIRSKAGDADGWFEAKAQEGDPTEPVTCESMYALLWPERNREEEDAEP